MGPITRHPLPVALCATAVALVAAFFVFARPRYRAEHHASITIPAKQPAADAAGRAGWVWADGVPGWAPGTTIKGFNVSQIQPVEAQPAQLAAAHTQLDAAQVRVIDAQHVRPGEGPLAVLAAPMLDATPQTVCLAATLPRPAPVVWRCPGASRPGGDVASARVFVAGVANRWPPYRGKARVAFNVVGVARGDVWRIVLHVPHHPEFTDRTLYERGQTWGQFETAMLEEGSFASPELRIYGKHGLVQTLPLDLQPGGQRVID